VQHHPRAFNPICRWRKCATAHFLKKIFLINIATLWIYLLQWSARNGVFPCRWYAVREHDCWPSSRLSGYWCLFADCTSASIHHQPGGTRAPSRSPVIFWWNIYQPLYIMLVHVKQLVRCTCISVRLSVCPDNNYWTNDLWPRYLACWFILTLSRSGSKVMVIGKGPQSQEENKNSATAGMVDRSWKADLN